MAETLQYCEIAIKAPWYEESERPLTPEQCTDNEKHQKETAQHHSYSFLAPGELDELEPLDELAWKDRGSAKSRESDRGYRDVGDRLWNGGGNRGIPTGLSRKAAGRGDDDDQEDGREGGAGDGGDDGGDDGSGGHDNTSSTFKGSGALPVILDGDGRPVTEPPVLSYDHMLESGYMAKRDALLRPLDGDITKATEIVNIDIEHELLSTYVGWGEEKIRDSAEDPNSEAFFSGLLREIKEDLAGVAEELHNYEARLTETEKGKWVVSVGGRGENSRDERVGDEEAEFSVDETAGADETDSSEGQMLNSWAFAPFSLQSLMSHAHTSGPTQQPSPTETTNDSTPLALRLLSLHTSTPGYRCPRCNCSSCSRAEIDVD